MEFNLNWIIYFWAFLGIVATILMKNTSLARATSAGTSFWRAFEDWMGITWRYFLFALIILFASLNFEFLGMVPPETSLDAFTRGMAIFAIAEMARQIKNPIQVETTNTNNLKLKK